MGSLTLCKLWNVALIMNSSENVDMNMCRPMEEGEWHTIENTIAG